MERRKYSKASKQNFLTMLDSWPDGQADFASRHGLPKATRYNWVRASRPRSTGLVEMKRGEADMPATTVIECWTHGIHFRFDRLPDTTWLAGLVQKPGQ